MRFSSPDAMREILRHLRRVKGATLRELARIPTIRQAYEATDYEPEYLLFDTVKVLVLWRLLEAWEGDQLIPSERFALIDDHLGFRTEYRFFISPFCIDLEAAFGVSFLAGSHAVFGAPRELRRPPDLFVLMPFATDLEPVYEDHIRKVAKRCELSVARADDFFTHGTILADIWSAINHATVILADCTRRNPNVFYEIGLSHCLGKPTILVTQDLDDVPFDLRHLRVLQYAYNPRGMAEFEDSLEKVIRGVIETAAQQSAEPDRDQAGE